MKGREVSKTLKLLVYGLLVLLVGFLGFKSLGYKPIVVISGSMEPNILTNSLVIIDTNTKYEDLEVGDVINYTHPEHKGVIHRVFQKSKTVEGPMLLTSGINPKTNQVIDNWVVGSDMYEGKVVKVFNWLSPIITFLFGNLVHINPLHIVFGFLVTTITLASLIILIMKGVLKMRENRELVTDVYVVTEHKKNKKKAKIQFKGVLGKILVGTVILSTALGTIQPVNAQEIRESYNLASNITQNYELSVEHKIYEVRDTINKINDLKRQGLVTNEVLKTLTNQLLDLEKAVQLNAKEATDEVIKVIQEVKETVKGVNGAETVNVVLNVIEKSLEVESISIINKGTQAVTSFSDVKQKDWFYKDVMTLSGKGIVSGVSNAENGVGKYDPQGTVSLGQFLAISTRLVAKDYIKEIKGAGHWAAGNYDAAIQGGLIGSKDFNSTPSSLNAGISREDMAYILVNVAKVNGENLTIKNGIENNIKDYNSISKGRQEAVMKAYSNGLLVGDNAGNFNPKKTLSRAEVAAVFCRVMNYTARPEVVVKSPVTGVQTREPMTLRYDDPNRPMAIEGDTFIKPDGTKVVLIVGPSGILGELQGVATEIGRAHPNGKLIKHKDLGSNEKYLGQPYYVDERTGEGHYQREWDVISTRLYKEAVKIENPKDGQWYGDYFMYQGGQWYWAGPNGN